MGLAEYLTIASLVALSILAWEMLSGFIWGAGYEPVPMESLNAMIELSKPDSGKKVYDLGSGFGRIVIEVAKRTGATCIGVEIDPLKWWWSTLMVARKGLSEKVKIVRKNFFNVNVSDADIVYVFLWGSTMEKLKQKFRSEMKPGSVVVSYWHKFKGWEPEKVDEKRRVYLYKVDSHRA